MADGSPGHDVVTDQTGCGASRVDTVKVQRLVWKII